MLIERGGKKTLCWYINYMFLRLFWAILVLFLTNNLSKHSLIAFKPGVHLYSGVKKLLTYLLNIPHSMLYSNQRLAMLW